MGAFGETNNVKVTVQLSTFSFEGEKNLIHISEALFVHHTLHQKINVHYQFIFYYLFNL